jgi:putative ABC transport system permease protein
MSNVSQRMEFFGLLRCLGATRRQVLRFVRREALQWCITAIPIGIGLSIVVVWGLCAVMRQLSTVWFGYMPIFGISWLSIGVSIVLGLITVLLAARTPAKMAAKVSPLEAVTGNTQQESSFRHAANTRRWHVEVVFHFRLTPNSFSTPSDILKMRSAALA